ncbi:PIN domain-containing protein [Halochromatium glycolicum]|uniref:PIN domain-containing protein n=1 Tax=Halochromatium glycolicum TaxID=85075 RepID=A0AAJ0U8F5_9GAMM|nr:PIN domain-containing protein [Halochromatium glycolicum]MBK1707249.1 hypothetical protein [Halochromatium glycolicum]
MSAICLVDTTVFLEILNVPIKAKRHQETLAQLRERIASNSEELFLPMATVLETGNHIGQNGDGQQRRQCAERFVEQVRLALEGKSPFKPLRFLDEPDFLVWLQDFPEHASRGSGLGDLSIIQDWQRLCAQNPHRRVYIWSFDRHLIGYDRSV